MKVSSSKAGGVQLLVGREQSKKVKSIHKGACSRVEGMQREDREGCLRMNRTF